MNLNMNMNGCNISLTVNDGTSVDNIINKLNELTALLTGHTTVDLKVTKTWLNISDTFKYSPVYVKEEAPQPNYYWTNNPTSTSVGTAPTMGPLTTEQLTFNYDINSLTTASIKSLTVADLSTWPQPKSQEVPTLYDRY